MKKMKKGLVATALSVSAAVALTSAAAMGATPQSEVPKSPQVKMSVGRITPVNLLSDLTGFSYNASPTVTRLTNCNKPDCNCLCGVRG